MAIFFCQNHENENLGLSFFNNDKEKEKTSQESVFDDHQTNNKENIQNKDNIKKIAVDRKNKEEIKNILEQSIINKSLKEEKKPVEKIEVKKKEVKEEIFSLKEQRNDKNEKSENKEKENENKDFKEDNKFLDKNSSLKEIFKEDFKLYWKNIIGVPEKLFDIFHKPSLKINDFLFLCSNGEKKENSYPLYLISLEVQKILKIMFHVDNSNNFFSRDIFKNIYKHFSCFITPFLFLSYSNNGLPIFLPEETLQKFIKEFQILFVFKSFKISDNEQNSNPFSIRLVLNGKYIFFSLGSSPNFQNICGSFLYLREELTLFVDFFKSLNILLSFRNIIKFNLENNSFKSLMFCLPSNLLFIGINRLKNTKEEKESTFLIGINIEISSGIFVTFTLLSNGYFSITITINKPNNVIIPSIKKKFNDVLSEISEITTNNNSTNDINNNTNNIKNIKEETTIDLSN